MKWHLPQDTISKNQAIEAIELSKLLVRAGYPTYLIGGAVRDSLLNIPSPNFDICTACPANALTELIPEAEPWGRKRYSAFRIWTEWGEIEFARFRREDACDGRHCEVIFTDKIEEDIVRRDFTVNAIAVEPETLEIVNFVGGIEDLNKRTIRAIGDPELRFREDRLRMLRAVRFAAKLDFDIHIENLLAIKRQACGIESLSAERIRSELDGIAISRHPGKGFRLLSKTGLFERIFDGGRPLSIWATSRLELAAGEERPLVWAIFLYYITKSSKQKAREIVQSLKFPKKDYNRIFPIFDNLVELVGGELSEDFYLKLADSPELGNIAKALELVSPKRNLMKELRAFFPTLSQQPFLRGDSLSIALRGISCEKIPELLAKIRKAELTGELTSKADVLQIIENFRRSCE